MKKLGYESLVIGHGRPWADRVTSIENGMPEFPEGDVYQRGCPTCAGYGMPGWVEGGQTGKWAKCDNCNYDKANQTGRKVYKRADQTYQVDGGKWMPV